MLTRSVQDNQVTEGKTEQSGRRVGLYPTVAGMTGQDVKEVCTVSLVADGDSCGEAPASVLALAEKQGAAKKQNRSRDVEIRSM